jgi:hypothetical protein
VGEVFASLTKRKDSGPEKVDLFQSRGQATSRIFLREVPASMLSINKLYG